MNITKLAKIAGVSTSTVSRALNNSQLISTKTRERIQQLAKEHDYIPNDLANGLLKNRTNAIGILTTDIRAPHYSSIVHTLESELNANGLHVFLCNTGGDFDRKQEYLSILLRNRVDGIILVGSVYNEQHGNEHILKVARSVPVLLINNILEAENVYCIAVDYAAGIFAAVEYAIKCGKRNLLFVARHETLSRVQKYAGFRRAVDNFSVLEGNYRFFQPPEIPTHDPLSSMVPLVDRLRSLRNEFPFDAVVADDDSDAIIIMKALQILGCEIPGKVGVLGFNDSYLCQYSSPSLSSMDVHERTLGKETAARTVQLLKGSEKLEPVKILTPHLVIRDSM